MLSFKSATLSTALLLTAALAMPGCGGKEETAPAPATPETPAAETSNSATQAAAQFSQEAQAQAEKLIGQLKDELKNLDLQDTSKADGMVKELTGLKDQVTESTQSQIDELAKQYESLKSQANQAIDDLKKQGNDLLNGLGQ